MRQLHERQESADPRDESEEQRDDRNLAEPLQELRVAGLGVQVLFGFLLSHAFTTKFSKLSHGQRDVYLASLVLAAVSIGGLWFAFPLARRRLRPQSRHPASTPQSPGCRPSGGGRLEET